MDDRDVILIDTAGRGPDDATGLVELHNYLSAVPTLERHLVLSATCGRRNLERAVENFGALGIDRVLFTKLDEAIGFGVVLDCLRKTTARLSYFTTGQNVPDDIEVGTPRRLAEAIVGFTEPAERGYGARIS
jgi:flagellar biosynthesis protein FlhF